MSFSNESQDEPPDSVFCNPLEPDYADEASEPASQNRFLTALDAIANSALLPPCVAATVAMAGVTVQEAYTPIPTLPAILGGLTLYAGGRVADWHSTRRTFRASDRAAERNVQSGIREEGLNSRGATTLAEFDQKSRRLSSVLSECAVFTGACITPYISVPFAAASWIAAYNNRRLEKKINKMTDNHAG